MSTQTTQQPTNIVIQQSGGNWKNILLIVFSCIIVALIMSTTCTSQKLDIAENNIKALTDTINIYTLKNQNLLYEKQGYILDKQNLEKYIGIKEKEIKEIEKKLDSSISTIAKLKGQVVIDTIQVVDSIYIKDDVLYNDFTYKDDWVYIAGVSTYKDELFNTTLNSINVDIPLKVGTTKDNKWFVTSENPYVKFTSIEGVNIEKAKPKRWSINAGVGAGAVGGWGVSGAADGIVRDGWIVGFGFYAGIGISYKIFDF
jgi:hypothetical protein